jgi:hypothetical protein
MCNGLLIGGQLRWGPPSTDMPMRTSPRTPPDKGGLRYG